MTATTLGILVMAMGPMVPAAEGAPKPALSRAERRVVEYVDAHAEEAVALLERLVAINSGTQNVEGVRAVGEIFARELAALGFETRLVDPLPPTGRGPHLVAEKRGGRGRRLLLIGHLDTVFEKDHPFQRWERSGSQASGPGAVDMKGGDVILLQALRALHAAGELREASIIVVLTGDEEDPGSPLEAARRDLVEAARRSDVALAFEAAVGLETATVGRRGSSEWMLTVTGTAAHSSGIFGEDAGAGAVFEAARILDGFYRELGGEANLTFNPGLILGGDQVSHEPKEIRGTAAGKTNIVAREVVVQGDLRFLSEEQKEKARQGMRRIVAEGARPRTSAQITFQDGYPAMAPTPGNHTLLAVLDRVSRDLDFGPVAALDPSRRGAGDVSFVAGLVDGLDGLGALGSGGHTARETIDLSTLPTLTKRAAVLIGRLTNNRESKVQGRK